MKMKSGYAAQQPSDTSDQILHWTSGCQISSQTTNIGLAGSLFELILDLFTYLGRCLPTHDPEASKPSYSRIAKDEAERLLLWGECVSASDGQLDDVLSRSTHLRRAVLTSIYGLGLTLHCEYMRTLFHTEAAKSGASSLAAELQGLLDRTAIILERTPANADPDRAIDNASFTDASEDFLRDISVYIDCLMDLSFAIGNPVFDTELVDSVPTAMEVFDVSCSVAEVFCRRIRDRFSKLPKWLVERLGEANARRSESLRSRREVESPRSPQRLGPVAAKYPVPYGDLTDPSEALFSDSQPKHTETTLSTYQADSIFDKPNPRPHGSGPGHVGPGSGSAIDDMSSFATFASFSTTHSEAKLNRARVPPLPIEAFAPGNFMCFACNQPLKGPLSRLDWKKHLFLDLSPYICTFQACLAPDTQYGSTREWAVHQSMHVQQYRESLTCPFCDKTNLPASTSNTAYYKHIADHLREVSLAALPQGAYLDDDEEEEISDADSAQYDSYADDDKNHLLGGWDVLGNDENQLFGTWGVLDRSSIFPTLPRSVSLPTSVRNAIPGYVDIYWQRFHPKYPIVHRASLESAGESMLRSAMAAVGTQFLDNKEDQIRGSLLFEHAWLEARRCLRWNLQIMQTMVLCEFFARFRGQEATVRPSKTFESLYSKVSSPEASLSSNNFDREVQQQQLYESAQQRWYNWVHEEACRRLFAACFLIDVHASMLFEKDRVRDFDLSAGSPPIPLTQNSEALWEARTADEFTATIQEPTYPPPEVPVFIQPCDALHEDVLASYPPFDRALILAVEVTRLPSRSAVPATPSETFASSDAEANIARLFPSDPVAHAYLALHHTPLLDLLVVSGDSWAFGQKVLPPLSFLEHKNRLKSWANGVASLSSPLSCSAASVALGHAARALDCLFSREPGAPNMADLSEYWVGYVCALICWACWHRAQDSVSRSGRSEKVNLVRSDNEEDKKVDEAEEEEVLLWLREVGKMQPDKALHAGTYLDAYRVVRLLRQRLSIECVGGRSRLFVDAVECLRKLEEGLHWKWF